MIVGFDATTLVGRISGVGYYTYRLLQSLAAARERGAIERVIAFSNRTPAAPAVPGFELERSFRFPVRSAWMQLLLPLLLRRVRPDVVHFTNYLAPLFPGVPYVVSIHDMSLTLMPECHTLKKRLLTSSLVPAVARGARLALVPSESTRRDVVRLLGLDAGRVRVVPYAASEIFRPVTDRLADLAALGVEPPYLLYVGTLEPRKNLPRALRAFARVAASLKDTSFVLAGQRGWKADDVMGELARPELRGRARMLGYVPEELLPALYSHATALVYPSLYEGFGFPIVEAMACGTPVLTSTGSSLEEVAGDAALLVDPRDETALAEGYVALSRDPALAARLRDRGLRRSAEYSWERTSRETIELYREAASRGTDPA